MQAMICCAQSVCVLCVHIVSVFVCVAVERRYNSTNQQCVRCGQSMGGRRAISLNTREVTYDHMKFYFSPLSTNFL